MRLKNRKKIRYGFGSLIAAMVLPFFCLHPAMADWTADFTPPETSDAKIRIDLPDDLDVITLTQLGVELDGIDITSLLSLDGVDFIYKPLQTLEGNEHTLKLVMLNPDGSSEVRQQWTFTIVGDGSGSASNLSDLNETTPEIEMAERLLRSAYFRADTLTEFSRRVVQQNIGHATNRSTLSGSGDVNSGFAAGKWTVDGHANYLMQSDVDFALTERTIDLGEYDVNADYQGDTLTGGFSLGHHDTGLETLLVSDFYRRGVSARIGTSDRRVEAQGFAFGTESVSGAADMTGLNSTENRLKGVSLSVKPFATDVDALKLTGTYYDGLGEGSGIGLSDLDSSASGSGWGIGVEKSFGHQRTRLKAQYAHTLFDQDGDHGDAPKDSSDAVSLLIDHRLFDEGPVIGDDLLNIDVGFGYDRVDTFFESLANPGMISDRDAYTAFSNLYWGALSANIYALHETNNVDGLANVPTDRLKSIDFGMNYSFDQQTGSREWLGTPYLYMNSYFASLGRVKTPNGYEGGDTDNLSSSITLGGGASYDVWYWSLSHSYSRFDDYTNISSDTVNNLTGLDVGWAVSDRLQLNGGTQFGVFEDLDTNKNSFSTNLYLGATAELVPEKVELNFDYNLNLANGSGDSSDSHIVNSEVEWTFLRPRTNRPGLALALRGSMEEFNGNADSAQNETEYQAYMVLRVKAPFSLSY
ncbi:hypothetical protein [uncultured Kiloniella sp.]|uniref:hypothetical protein n=1 Tax=uncultured Kiloniella sp. TaxID=1133091 RepID=UPI0026202727|nr:hypothetical protein [uncultured Kiloniella sp.]